MLNAPNADLIEARDEMLEGFADNTQTVPIEMTQFNKKLEEMFADYFTEEAFQKKLKTSAFTEYHSFCEGKQHTIEVDSIDIEKNKKFKRNYDFIVHVRYGPLNGEKTPLDIKGSAQFGEEKGKISFLQIFGAELVSKVR